MVRKTVNVSSSSLLKQKRELKTLNRFLKMNNYTFDVKLKDGEIIRDTVCAPSRLVGESIILEMYSAVSINLVSVN